MQKFQELNKEDVSITDLLNAIEDIINTLKYEITGENKCQTYQA